MTRNCSHFSFSFLPLPFFHDVLLLLWYQQESKAVTLMSFSSNNSELDKCHHIACVKSGDKAVHARRSNSMPHHDVLLVSQSTQCAEDMPSAHL